MNNNLVLSVHTALIQTGFVSLRFNFRGVGNSQGVHAQGEEEAEDAEAALSLLKDRPEVGGARVGMAGYSFGSGVILGSLARYSKSRAFVLFSPSVRYLEDSKKTEDPRPNLVICGDRDHAIPVAALKDILGASTERYRIVAGADHFWQGYEGEAARHAVEFFTKNLM